MKVYFASDHAGFETKNKLVEYVRDHLKCDVEEAMVRIACLMWASISYVQGVPKKPRLSPAAFL